MEEYTNKLDIVVTDRTLHRQAMKRAERRMAMLQDVQDEESPQFATISPVSSPEIGDDNTHIVSGNGTGGVCSQASAVQQDFQQATSQEFDDLDRSDADTYSDYSSDSDLGDDSLPEKDDLAAQLREWILDCGIAQAHAQRLLGILRHHFTFLPKDIRTLLETRRSCNIQEVAGGFYHHFGIRENLRQRLLSDPTLLPNDQLSLQINVDGLPLFKSTTTTFWPILGMLQQEQNPEPFVIGLWLGQSKPTDSNHFMQKFVEEMQEIEAEGFAWEDRLIQVKIVNVICDTPARAFIKKVKGHTGYFGCDFCEQSGEWKQHRMTFPQSDAAARTDVKFDEMHYIDEHQHDESILTRLTLGMVSQFPLDYMHLVCLGVVKKLLSMWMCGPLQVRVAGNMIRCISDKVCSLKNYLPREFVRKGRTLDELERWKATEFRTFLLYTGPIALRGKLSSALYDNFMLLSVAITLLCSPAMYLDYFSYASDLLCVFVENFSTMYGSQHVVYNVHCLTHLASHASQHGPLHAFSSFPFENYLRSLKKLIRKPNQPLAQAVRRIMEKRHIVRQCPQKRTYCKKQHGRGPLPNFIDVTNCVQYREIHTPKYVLSSKSPDNGIQVKDNVFVIRNVLLQNGNISILCQRFGVKENFFTYPADSSRLNIFRVKSSSLSHNLTIIRPDEITFKVVLLPHGDGYVSIPLL